LESWPRGTRSVGERLSVGASERRNRAAVEEDGADGWGRLVSGREARRVGRSVRTERSQRGFGPSDPEAGPGACGGPRGKERERGSRGWAGKRRKEREGRRISAQGENGLRDDFHFDLNAEIDLNLIQTPI